MRSIVLTSDHLETACRSQSSFRECMFHLGFRLVLRVFKWSSTPSDMTKQRLKVREFENKISEHVYSHPCFDAYT